MANKTLTTISAATLLGLSALSAHAGSTGTLTIDWDSRDARTIYYSDSYSDHRYPYQYNALEFDIDLTIDALDLENFDSSGYCVELSQGIGRETYDFYFSSLSELNSDLYYEIAWLVDTYAPTDNYEDNSVDRTDNNTAGALQGLIWDIMDDSIVARATSNQETSSLFRSYRDALSSLVLGDDIKSYLDNNYMIAQNNSYQDLIVKIVQPTPTPEPGTLLLFGYGLAGLAGIRVRRKKK